MLRHLGLGLNVIALGLLFPGIMLPMFSLDMSLAASISGAPPLGSTLIDKELSILQTVKELWQDNRGLVALLIFVFSVCIPLLKTSLITASFFTKNPRRAFVLSNIVNIVGKWSMADVFVVAIFLAVLSTNHADTQSQQAIAVMGFKLNIGISSETLSHVGPGFYYFLGYCLISILGSQLMTLATLRNNSSALYSSTS